MTVDTAWNSPWAGIMALRRPVRSDVKMGCEIGSTDVGGCRLLYRLFREVLYESYSTIKVHKCKKKTSRKWENVDYARIAWRRRTELQSRSRYDSRCRLLEKGSGQRSGLPRAKAWAFRIEPPASISRFPPCWP